MPTSILGLPLHPLIVHATVVFVPTAAAAVPLAALWPRFRRWAGWGPLAVSVVALVLTPLSTASGENLRHQMPQNPLIARHSQLADGLLPWTAGLAVVAALLYLLHRGHRPGLSASARPPGSGWSRRPGGRSLLVAATVLAVVAALGTTVQVALIGHSGAKAAWAGVGSRPASAGTGG